MRRIEAGSSPSPQAVPLEEASHPQPASPAASSPPSAVQVQDASGYEPLFPAQTRSAHSALAELDHLLTRRVSDFAISDEDANRALQVLQETRPQDLTRVIQQLDRSGKLETFLNESNPETRHQALELLWSEGHLQRKLATPPSGNFNPPVPPEPFVADHNLPEPLQQAIHSDNRQAWSQYETRFKQYQERFATAVQNTHTPAELRSLGAPVGHAAGARMSDADHAMLAKVAEFMGRPKPGSAGLSVSLENGWIDKQVDIRRLGTDGIRPRTEFSQELPSAKYWPVMMESWPDGKSLLKVDAGVASVGLGNEGTVEVEVGRSARATVDGDGASASGGACTPLPLVKVCIDGDIAGASPRDNAGTIQTSNFWELPVELKRGLSWEALPQARRQDLQRQLWTPQEWSDRQAGREN